MTKDTLGAGDQGAVLLPDDAVTAGFAILARRRSGKSNLAGVIEETFCERGDPWVCLDPVSAHWGIRYADDGGQPGKASGYEVLIVGGKYGDEPLDDKAGGALAQILVETGISCVIDLGGESMNARQKFVADFAIELLKINTTPRHVILEEADEFVPQMLVWDNQKYVRGALTRLIKQGGGLGIGFSLISQRPASVAKDVLEQIDHLFVLRMKGPNDLKAVQSWFEHNIGDKAEMARILTSIASFQPGDAWLCSSEGEVERFKVRPRRTYHAGRTPKRGEEMVEPERVPLREVIARFKAAAAKRQVAVTTTEAPTTKISTKAVKDVSNDAETTTLREERDTYREAWKEAQANAEDLRKSRDEEATRANREQAEAEKYSQLRAALGELGLNGGGGGLGESDVRRIVGEMLRDLPRGGDTVYLPAPEVLRKKYQQQAVERVLARVAALSADEREALTFLLAHDAFLTINRVAVGISGNDAGATRKRWETALQGLVSAGIVAIGGSGRSGRKAAVRAWVARELAAHAPTDAEIDQTHNAVLARIAGAPACLNSGEVERSLA